jgi:methionyl-tRNA synthetase
MKQVRSRVEQKFEDFRIKEALEEVVAFAREGNRYLNEKEPWRAYKGSRESAGQTLGIAIQIVGTLAIMLQPFLPTSAAAILAAVSGRKTQKWSYAGRNFIEPGSRIQPLEPLFHKVSASALKKRLENLRTIKNVDVEA